MIAFDSMVPSQAFGTLDSPPVILLVKRAFTEFFPARDRKRRIGLGHARGRLRGPARDEKEKKRCTDGHAPNLDHLPEPSFTNMSAAVGPAIPSESVHSNTNQRSENMSFFGIITLCTYHTPATVPAGYKP